MKDERRGTKKEEKKESEAIRRYASLNENAFICPNGLKINKLQGEDNFHKENSSKQLNKNYVNGEKHSKIQKL